jgi:serine protease Do
MVNRRTLDPFRRAAIAAGAAATAVFLLAGCGAGGGEPETGPEPAGFDDLELATVYIKGQGTFIDPGSLDPAEGRWIGSGFVVSEDGLVVTNNHVVTGAGALDVLLGGEDEVGGKVLGASECLDLAVIQLDEGGDYSFLAWHEGEIKTGLDVYSAGYPLGAAEEFTLTRGIVSKDDFPLDTQWASLEHVIEHDARIRGGNSGGPLVDEDGAVVGVNYAGDDSLDYNFAIHRDVVQEHLDDLAAGERVQSIGINAQAWVSEDGSLYGVWVQSVEAGGPADATGIEPGDLIFSLAGVTVGDDGTLGAYCQVLDTQGSDATIDIQVYRPASDELLDGQINGDELSVVQSGYLGGEVPDDGGFQNVTDDAGVLNMSVPAEWAQVDGAGFTDDSGTAWYSLSAAPDLNAFWESFTGSGVQFMGAVDAGRSAEDLLTSLSGSFDSACSPGAAGQPYDDGFYVGVYSEWDCSGTAGIVVSTQDATGNSAVLILQLNGEYETTSALSEILSTFYFQP